MGYVVTNKTDKPIPLTEHVSINPGPEGALPFAEIPDWMKVLEDEGKISIKDADETLAEREADAAAFDPDMGKKEAGV